MEKHIYPILAFIFILFPVLVKAQSTSIFDADYFNKSSNIAPPIKVGKGFHINDIYKPTRTCFTTQSCDINKLSSQQQGKKTKLQIFYTKTEDEYNSFISKGSSGKVSFLNLFSTDGKNLTKFSSQTICESERLIFIANVDFGIYSYPTDPILDTSSSYLISQSKFIEFIDRYGTHYINGVRRESTIRVILTKKYSSQIQSDSEDNNIKIGADIPYRGNGSLELSNATWANKKLEEDGFNIEVEIIGPTLSEDDFKGKINGVLTGNSSEKANAISGIIDGAIKRISDPTQSAITQYYYAPFTLYDVKGISWDETKQNELTKINENIIKVYSLQSQIEELVSISAKEKIKKEFSELNIPNNSITNIILKYEEILPNLKQLKLNNKKILIELEKRYTTCANIMCIPNTGCCNNDSYFEEIENLGLNSKFDNEYEKLIETEIKEINISDCERNETGSITIINTSTNPYDLYQDNNLIETIKGKSTITFDVTPATYQIKAVQKSGYLAYPTINIRNAPIQNACQEVQLEIGFED